MLCMMFRKRSTWKMMVKKYERKNSFLCRIMIASLLRIVKFNKNGAERRRDSSCEPEIQREAFMCWERGENPSTLHKHSQKEQQTLYECTQRSEDMFHPNLCSDTCCDFTSEVRSPGTGICMHRWEHISIYCHLMDGFSALVLTLAVA